MWNKIRRKHIVKVALCLKGYDKGDADLFLGIINTIPKPLRPMSILKFIVFFN